MRALALAALVLVTGCVMRVGQHVRDYPAATRAEGTQVAITTYADSIQGELVEARDTALVVASPTRLALVPLRWITVASFADLRRRPERPLSQSDIERLRFLSRYPYGMPSPALSAMLSARNQAALAVIDR